MRSRASTVSRKSSSPNSHRNSPSQPRAQAIRLCSRPIFSSYRLYFMNLYFSARRRISSRLLDGDASSLTTISITSSYFPIIYMMNRYSPNRSSFGRLYAGIAMLKRGADGIEGGAFIEAAQIGSVERVASSYGGLENGGQEDAL